MMNNISGTLRFVTLDKDMANREVLVYVIQKLKCVSGCMTQKRSKMIIVSINSELCYMVESALKQLSLTHKKVLLRENGQEFTKPTWCFPHVVGNRAAAVASNVYKACYLYLNLLYISY